ncbi:MAG: hypothetical protein LBU57_03195 [Dysgonamonadaceae bacterium]|jgi:hypothetical protein|nr:hypothetical protein [Dysgonamonadaceae bacterium]
MKSKWLFIPVLMILFLSACDKLLVNGLEGIDADLQGKWQEKTENTVYYNFQNNLFEYQKYIRKDSILSVYGYYTLIGDTAIYLELLPRHTQINMKDAVYPLDFLGWDTIPGNQATDTLTQQFNLKLIANKDLKLSNGSKKYNFRKF